MKPRIIDSSEVALKNLDLSQRVLAEGITFAYHQANDVLVVTIGHPSEAITEPLLDNIFYRTDPETLKIVGIEIVEFKRDFLPNNRAAQEYFHLLYRGEVSEKELVFKDPREAPGLRELLAMVGATRH